MAIIVRGTPCPLCGKPISETDETVAFPPFTANRRDPLFPFSDGVFHDACFRKHPLAGRVEARVEEFDRQRARPRICAACREEIRDPDDYFTVGFLTDDEESPVFAFNYLELHRSHLREWSEYPRLRREVGAFQSSSAWEGPCVRWGD